MNDRITVRESPSPSLNAEVMDWIAQRVREEPVADDCAAFVAAHPLPPRQLRGAETVAAPSPRRRRAHAVASRLLPPVRSR